MNIFNMNKKNRQELKLKQMHQNTTNLHVRMNLCKKFYRLGKYETIHLKAIEHECYFICKFKFN